MPYYSLKDTVMSCGGKISDCLAGLKPGMTLGLNYRKHCDLCDALRDLEDNKHSRKNESS